MKRLLFIAVYLSILAGTARAQELPFTHYTTDSERNPLPSADVSKVYQDRLGYIWMAVFSSGLVRYDGATMEIYTVEDGLRDLDVWGLVEDPAGRLWVASNAGLVISEEPLRDYEPARRIRFKPALGNVPLLNQRVWTHNVAIGPDGSVWAGTARDGVLRYGYDADGFTHVDTLATRQSSEAENAAVLAVAVRRDSTMWISVENGGLLVFDVAQDELTTALDVEALQGENVSVLYESAAGTLWAGTQEGRLLRLTDRKGRVGLESVGPRLSAGVVGIAETADRELWAATEGDGVLHVHLDDGHYRLISRENGLLSKNVHFVMQDVEGNVWFAQSGGVSKLRVDHAAFENYSARSHAGEHPVLPAAGVGSVLSASDPADPCAIWAATSEGGAACIGADGTSAYLQEEDGLRTNWVNAVHRDRRGRLWFGTVRGITGVSFDATPLPVFGDQQRVEVAGKRGRLRHYTSLTILSVSSSDIPRGGNSPATTEALWFPGIRHLIALVDDQWYVFSSGAGLPPSVLNTAALDDEGYLWVGTRDRGLYRSTERISAQAMQDWPSEEVRLGGEFFGRQISTPIFEPVWSIAKGAPSDNMGPLLWREGRLWVGTTQGLAVLDGRSGEQEALLTRSDGLGANYVTSMAISPMTGSLWVGTNAGLAELNPDTYRVLRTVTHEDGLIDNEVWLYGSVHVATDGTVYFGTAKGIAVYRPELDRANDIEPHIRLRSVAFSTSGSTHNEILFGYAALSFTNEKAVRYRTRLVGYDRDWSDETSDAKLRYTNLPAYLTSRSYTLEVMARNNDGVWVQQPLSYAFEVPAPPWLRWWAFVVYGVIFWSGVLLFLRMQRRQFIRKEQERARAREMQLAAEAALARSEAAEAKAKALQAENERKAVELARARELQHAYQELQQAHVHLKTTQAQLVQQEKMASLGQLTAGIAHEIKNPLNFINNFAQLSEELLIELAEALESKADRKEVGDLIGDLRVNAAKIHEHGKRADGIVRGMMQHARGGERKREQVDLNRLVDEYVSLAAHGMRSQMADFAVPIERVYADDLPEIELVAQDMGRVLLNILTNAHYAVHERGQKVNGHYEPLIRIKTLREDSAVEIHISDNGTGIPSAVKDKIFEPFFTTKPTGSGTGLGLSLAYDIVTQGHGGSLSVESSPGAGATFIVRLPLGPSASGRNGEGDGQLKRGGAVVQE